MLADSNQAASTTLPRSPSSTHRLQCLFSGRVQGVGFRYTVKNIAMCHDVRGYVRNLSDGRVEVVMEGPENDMDQVITGVSSRMAQFIKNVNRNILPATGEFDHFYIKH